MTGYHGGKFRNGKKIADIINKFFTPECVMPTYCEPFHGMCGVYRHIEYKPNITYLAGDLNTSISMMWMEAQRGWVPPTNLISPEEFKILGKNGQSSAEKGFIGNAFAWGCIYFESYNRQITQSRILAYSKRVSDIALNTTVSKVKFSPGDYKQFSDLENAVIYCDPPYENIRGYRFDSTQKLNVEKFNNVEFWTWVKKMAEKNIVLISEYNIPEHVKHEVLLVVKDKDNHNSIKREKLVRVVFER